MATKPLPKPEKLHQLLRYEPETGKLFWRERGIQRGRPVITGGEAGHRTSGGYIGLAIMRRHQKAHRVAWALATGAWPEGEIDHINGVRSDNRWSNLRAVSRLENCRNRRLNRNNVSGHMGVRYSGRLNKWIAEIRVNKEYVYLGCHSTKAAAIEARVSAERRFAFHTNHGRS